MDLDKGEEGSVAKHALEYLKIANARKRKRTRKVLKKALILQRAGNKTKWPRELNKSILL